ncbi:galactokinase [Streptomyces goshikiensis]|uniref:galactokinase n=1 Tax=Streptomyces goshikiensis TaxID=1942 RepID=UPI003319933E
MNDAVRTAFAAVHGGRPEGIWAAPGRVDLIGEHTDYNDGFALPVALARTTRLAARRRTDGRLRLHSAQAGGPVVDLAVADLAPGAVTNWAAYPAGVVWALGETGHRTGGADLHFDSTVPTGAGLSSSAALRTGCERACALLGLAALRDLSPDHLPRAERMLPARLRPLVRHVVTENARVAEAVAHLKAGRVAELGPILNSAHASLRDDYRVSCAETDLAVGSAVAAGALGARITGGGFGGSVIALVAADRAERMGVAVTAAFRGAGYREPHLIPVTAAPGARRIE